MTPPSAQREARIEHRPVPPRRAEEILSDIHALLQQLIDLGRRKRGTPPVAGAARWAYQAGRTRRTIFGDRVVADQAWDILLDLFIARYEQRQVSVTSSCLAAAAPLTTAIRYIAHLEEAGLLKRSRNPRDARSSNLEITDEGARKMRDYFNEVLRVAETLYS